MGLIGPKEQTTVSTIYRCNIICKLLVMANLAIGAKEVVIQSIFEGHLSHVHVPGKFIYC